MLIGRAGGPSVPAPSLAASRPAAAPVRVALVGAGEFGATFAAQARRIPALALLAVCDRDPSRARAALLRAGAEPGGIADAADADAVRSAVARGAIAVLPDAALLSGLELDAVVEATGEPEAAAAVAELALRAGCCTALATKEAEIVVGPVLAHRARGAGLVHTPVDGDQPSLLIGLIARARLLGLEVVAAGKSTESDYVWDAAGGTLHAWGDTVPAPGFSTAFAPEADRLLAALPGRPHPDLPVATVPDLCEMGIVANHCGLRPDLPALHAPVARTLELPLLFRPRAEGGLLDRTGIVDVFACLRRPDEIGFAGGVFVVARAPDPETGRLLAGKGIPASPDGRYLLLHNPVHLLGVEAPISVLSAVRDRRGTGGAYPRQRYDLAARTDRVLEPGEVLRIGARHAVPGLSPLLLPARTLADGAPVPYYLAAGATVARPVAAGAVLTLADIVPQEGSTLLRLRREQDTELGAGPGIGLGTGPEDTPC